MWQKVVGKTPVICYRTDNYNTLYVVLPTIFCHYTIFCDRCKLSLPITPLTHHHKYTLNKVEYSGLYLYYNYYLVIQQKAVFYW